MESGKVEEYCNAVLFTGVNQPPIVQRLERPKIQHEEDVIIKVIKTSVCGTDLHILEGNVFSCSPGTRIGHEGIGEIVERGSKVTVHEIGERVLCQCITNCGNCKNCSKEFYGHCINAGWVLGNRIDGMQGEYCRVPYANTSCFKIPKQVQNTEIEDGILLACDVIPTGLEVGLLDGRIKENMTIAIIGMGPVGISTLMCSEMYKPKEVYFVDLNPFRCEIAESFSNLPGFANTKLIKVLNSKDDAAKQIMAHTNDIGVDLVVEAIGIPKGWEISQDVVRPGGHIALLGVHGKPGEINLERMWYKNFKMTAGLVHGYTTQMLIDKIVDGSLPADKIITHRMKLSQVEHAYKVFRSGINCLKIILVADDQWENQKYINKITHWGQVEVN